jgi:hypothetical protein
MTKLEVITGLCRLSTIVGVHLKSEYAHDCFCQHSVQNIELQNPPYYQFDEKIIDFIQDAIKEKICRSKGAK